MIYSAADIYIPCCSTNKLPDWCSTKQHVSDFLSNQNFLDLANYQDIVKCHSVICQENSKHLFFLYLDTDQLNDNNSLQF